MSSGLRVHLYELMLGLALLLGAQSAGAQPPPDYELNPRQAATKVKLLRALDGIKLADNLTYSFDEYREGQASLRRDRGYPEILSDRPVHPTEEELLARSEMILMRLGYRKGVDFELEQMVSGPEHWNGVWSPTRPDMGGQVIRFRRPADRGFYDREAYFQFEWNLPLDELTSLTVPGVYPQKNRVTFTKVVTKEEAARLASAALVRFEAKHHAFWARNDTSPATILKGISAEWASLGMLRDYERPQEADGIVWLAPLLADRSSEVPVYRVQSAMQLSFVRADTGEVIIAAYGPWSSPPSLSQQFFTMGLEAPRLSEFLVASTLGFWVLAPVLMLRAWRKRVRPKPLGVNDTPAAPDPPRATRPGTLT